MTTPNQPSTEKRCTYCKGPVNGVVQIKLHNGISEIEFCSQLCMKEWRNRGRG